MFLEIPESVRDNRIWQPEAGGSDPINTKPHNIGFIGLGLMGTGFTQRLIEMGHSVFGYDLDGSKVQAATGHGVCAVQSPADSAIQCDIVMVCVTSTAAV